VRPTLEAAPDRLVARRCGGPGARTGIVTAPLLENAKKFKPDAPVNAIQAASYEPGKLTDL